MSRVLKFRSCGMALAGIVFMGVAVSSSRAESIEFSMALTNTDWTSAGVSGVGGGSGTITLAGVTGPVSAAFLYWHGIGTDADQEYDNDTVNFNGTDVTGISLGDATTNCWGAGSSRAFRADVTALVAGDGAYTVTGLSQEVGHSANGASLIVAFDDGDDNNNRDIVFFEGNDSNIPEGFPGEDDGWNASLPGIMYSGGPVQAQLHVADGQDFTDGDLAFTTVNGAETILDVDGLYDGDSVPSAGTSRAGNGELWDIHSFDITGAFGGVQGGVTLDIAGMELTSDCLGLVLMILDFEAGDFPDVCALALGRGRGDSAYDAGVHEWTTALDSIDRLWSVTMDTGPEVEIWNPVFEAMKPPTMKHFQVYTAQVLLWNPIDFPTNPEQYSQGIEVAVFRGEILWTRLYGGRDGIDIEVERVVKPNGRVVLKFPFAIDGM